MQGRPAAQRGLVGKRLVLRQGDRLPRPLHFYNQPAVDLLQALTVLPAKRLKAGVVQVHAVAEDVEVQAEVHGVQLYAGDTGHPLFAGQVPERPRPLQQIVVGEGQQPHAPRRRRIHQLGRRHGPVGKAGVDVQIGDGIHPCHQMNLPSIF